MGVLTRPAFCLLILAPQGLSPPVRVNAEPASQPARKIQPITYACSGGWGYLSVAIEPDGTFRAFYGKELRGRLEPARHAAIVSAVQDVLKLRRIPWNPRSQQFHRGVYRLNWGGVVRNWDRDAKGQIPPELSRLEELLDPRHFDVDPSSTLPAEGQGP
jgi:hypothetical protein